MPLTPAKVKILFIQATPPDWTQLDINTELRNLDTALGSALERQAFEWHPLPAARIDDLLPGLRRHRPQIVHFSGHGSRHGEIILNTPDGAAGQPLSAEEFANTLRLYVKAANPPVRLVVLAGCHTAQAAELLSQDVACTVGMSATVDDGAMVKVFTPTLYRALGDGRSVKDAVAEARQALRNHGHDTEAKAVKLRMRKEVDAAALVLSKLPQPRQAYSDLHLAYLRDLFGKPWAQVKLAEMLTGRSDEVELLDVYVPLAIDFRIIVKTESNRIVDWWVKQKEDEGKRELSQERMAPVQVGEGILAGLPVKVRVWNDLKVGEDGLQEIVDGIQRKILNRKEAGEETKDAEHIWFMEAQDAASVQKRFVLLGTPGSGKSTFLRHLALCMAGELRRCAGDDSVPTNANLCEALNNDWLRGAYTPLYIELRDLVRQAFPTLPLDPHQEAEAPSCDHFWKYVREHLLAGDLASFSMELRQLFSQGEAILFLDGLDEVPDAADGRRRRQGQMKALVASLVGAYPDLSIIITGRPYAYRPEDWELRDFGRAELTFLEGRRLRELAEALFTAVKTDKPLEHAKAFSQALGEAVQQKKIKPSMHATPLFFTMLAALWLPDPSRGFPDTEAKLYQESISLLLGPWTRRRAPDGSVADKLGVKEPEQLRTVLEALACTVHEQSYPGEDTTVFHVKELLGILAEGGYDAKIQDVPEYLEQRVGLLVSPKPHHFAFLHRSFQEYLTACELLYPSQRGAQRQPPVADDRFFPEGIIRRVLAKPDLWKDVARLAIDQLLATTERVFDAWELLASLCDPYLESGGTYQGAVLAMELAREHRFFKTTLGRRDRRLAAFGMLRDTAEKAIEDVKGIPTPKDRDIAGRLLGDGPHQEGGTKEEDGPLVWPPPGHDPRPGVGLRSDGLPDIAWVEIPDAGEFIYQKDERRTEPIFWIAKYLITYAQYCAFLKDKDGFKKDRWWLEPAELAMPEGHRDAPGNQQFRYWNHPAENVSWYDAVAFCRWLTAKARERPDLLPAGLDRSSGWQITLPTEWQWEKAARGHDGRQYPWGPEYNKPGYANINETWSGYQVGPHYLQKTSAVGMYPQGASPYGVLDMSGNVWEWCLNKYEKPDDPNPEEGSEIRVLRGGSWHFDVGGAAAPFRGSGYPLARDGYLGFRLVAVSASPFRSSGL